MLKIHSFLRRIKDMIKRAFLDSYKSCIMITAYTLVAIIIILSSDNLYGKGNRVVEAYAKVDSNINTFSPVEEETANEAQIQADELDQNVNVPLDKLASDNSTGLFNAVIADGSTLAYGSGFDTVRQNMKEDVLTSTEKLIQVQNEAEEKLRKERQEQAKEKEEALNKEKEEKAKKEQAQAKAKKSKMSITQLSSSDKAILQRIVEAEATGEDIKGKMLVANVILNRVACDRFPDTVEAVVFQKNGSTVQFSPIKDGRYWSVSISKTTIKAVNRVLAGEDESQGALFFSARSKADKSSMNWFDRNLKYLFKYGGHEFYTFKN